MTIVVIIMTKIMIAMIIKLTLSYYMLPPSQFMTCFIVIIVYIQID